MKANEFVKKFGLEEATEIAQGVPEKFKFKCLNNVCWDNNTYKYSDRFKPRSSLVNVADLKRLVESYELVESRGGLDAAKHELILLQKHLNNTFGYVTIITSEKIENLKQAIADVESCQ